MTAARPADILRLLEPPGAPDGDLLALFARTRDASAFAELVRRHGPLVLGVCRRVTGNVHDAEDAFQASFLVLAQKAGSLTNAALVGNWLYGVAFRVARRAKRAAARRRVREVTVPTMPDPPAPDARAAVPELGPILDEELAALAAHYRDAIVLCDLRGLSREAAAEALGVPEGTLSSRLANGRKKLAARLARRGVALPTAGLSAALGSATASVPAELLARTCETVTDWAATGTAPAALAALTKGGFVMRLSLLFGGVLALGITGAVLAALPASEPPVPPKPPALASADDKKLEAKSEAKPAFGAPRLARSFDVPSSSARKLAWNATGTHVAFAGEQPGERPKETHMAFMLFAPNAEPELFTGHAPTADALVAARNDGKGFVTVLREDGLISGSHRMALWRLRPPTEKKGTGYYAHDKVALDSTRAWDYVLAADEKTYRAVLIHEALGASAPRFEVIEGATQEGEPQRSLLKLGVGNVRLSPTGTRVALSPDDKSVSVYDVDAGKKLFDAALPNPDKPNRFQSRNMAFSTDGSRLFVTYGLGRSVVFDATGKLLPELEGIELIESHGAVLSGDGRLCASLVTKYKVEETPRPGGKQPAIKNYQHDGGALVVWDTDTGKVVRSWRAGHVVFAFAPTRPVLAVAEQNGDHKVRVGFWDFAAEMKK